MTPEEKKQRTAAANAAIRKLLLSAIPGVILMILGEVFMANATKAGHTPATWQVVCVAAGCLLNLVVVLRFRNTMRAIGLGSARRSRQV
jgi:hypothetical protein